jgi:hypothetical protein
MQPFLVDNNSCLSKFLIVFCFHIKKKPVKVLHVQMIDKMLLDSFSRASTGVYNHHQHQQECLHTPIDAVDEEEDEEVEQREYVVPASSRLFPREWMQATADKKITNSSSPASCSSSSCFSADISLPMVHLAGSALGASPVPMNTNISPGDETGEINDSEAGGEEEKEVVEPNLDDFLRRLEARCPLVPQRVR